MHGVPDLVIEILSPGNKKHDQVTKKNLYEKFAVKEFWIVDPETKEATGYWLYGNKLSQFQHTKRESGVQTSEHHFPFLTPVLFAKFLASRFYSLAGVLEYIAISGIDGVVEVQGNSIEGA